MFSMSGISMQDSYFVVDSLLFVVTIVGFCVCSMF